MAPDESFVGGEVVPGPLHPDRQIAANLLFDEPPTVTEEFAARPKSKREAEMIAAFTSLTGYKERDIMGINERSLTIVTAQGGKYQLNKALDRFRHLAGPVAPRPKRSKAKPKAVDSQPTSEDTEE